MVAGVRLAKKECRAKYTFESKGRPSSIPVPSASAGAATASEPEPDPEPNPEPASAGAASGFYAGGAPSAARVEINHLHNFLCSLFRPFAQQVFTASANMPSPMLNVSAETFRVKARGAAATAARSSSDAVPLKCAAPLPLRSITPGRNGGTWHCVATQDASTSYGVKLAYQDEHHPRASPRGSAPPCIRET